MNRKIILTCAAAVAALGLALAPVTASAKGHGHGSHHSHHSHGKHSHAHHHHKHHHMHHTHHHHKKHHHKHHWHHYKHYKYHYPQELLLRGGYDDLDAELHLREAELRLHQAGAELHLSDQGVRSGRHRGVQGRVHQGDGGLRAELHQGRDRELSRSLPTKRKPQPQGWGFCVRCALSVSCTRRHSQCHAAKALSVSCPRKRASNDSHGSPAFAGDDATGVPSEASQPRGALRHRGLGERRVARQRAAVEPQGQAEGRAAALEERA